MKKLIKAFILIVCVIIATVSFGGCGFKSCADLGIDFNTAEKLLEQGDYQYSYVNGPAALRPLKTGSYVAILGLTEEGKQKKTLIIPEEIDGKPVIQVGLHVALVYQYKLSGNYKRVYLPSTLLSTSDEYAGNQRVFFVGMPSKTLLENSSAWIRVSKDVYEQCHNENETKTERVLQIADVEYYFDGNLYWLDSCTWREPQKIIEPPEPKKEGYEFLGWFEENSETPWDFENNKIDFSKQDENGNYIRTKLIANFQVIN